MLAEETPRVLYVGSGNLGPFALSVSGTPITFPSSDHIIAIRYDSDGVPTTLVENTHYTLSADSVLPDVGESEQPVSAASLTLEVDQDVLANDEYLLIKRVTPAQQNLALLTSSGFSSANAERKFDEIIRHVQEIRALLARVITINELDDAGVLELSAAAARANTLLGFDADGALDYITNTFQGEQGVQGDPGADGTIWYTGSGAPSAGTGTTVDYYLNTANGDVYSKSTGSWVIVGNIRGAAGAGSGDMLKSENLSGLTNYTTARSNLGLGSAALLASSAVFQVSNNLSEGNAATMRGNLGLGTIATQAASSVAITGGSITGITDLAIADGGTGASTATAARTNLGLGTAAVLDETTTAQFLANTADKVLSTDQVWGAADLVALTDAATIAINMSLGINFSVTLGGNRTLGLPTNLKRGQTGVIYVTQDGVGSRTLAYNAAYKWANGTAGVLSTGASKIDRLTYFVRSATGGSEWIELTLTKDIR